MAVLLVLSVATASVVTAGTNTAVVSIHTTDTEFTAGTLTNMTVVGTGTAATVQLTDPGTENQTIDDFERGNINPYSGDTGAFAVQSTTVFEGSNALEHSGNSGDAAITNGSQNVSQGDTVYFRQYAEGARGALIFGATTNGGISDIQSAGEFAYGVDAVRGIVYNFTDTRNTMVDGTDASFDTWITGRLDWYESNDTIRLRTYEAGSKVADVKVQQFDTSQTDGYMGLYGTSSIGDKQYFDLVERETVIPAETATYISQNHTVENSNQGFVNITDNTNATGTVTWEGWDGTSWNQLTQSTGITTTGNQTFSWSESSTTKVRVNITVQNASGNGRASFEFADEGVQFTNTDPQVDNASATPSGGEKLSSSSVTLSATINDTDFALTQGDTVTGEFFVNGPSDSSFSSVGTDSRTSNGTLSVSYNAIEGGDYEWRVNISDEYGGDNKSAIFQFSTPSNVTFRNESNASQVVTGATITTTFFSADGTSVIQKTDSDEDGNISLAGLPTAKEFVVVVEANGWYTRRVFIESIFDQQTIYLLNSTAYPNAIDTTFVYEDRTGDFPPEDTTLRIQRAVDVDGDDTFAWETVAGDFWGAAGEFPFTGQTNARYRLIIENAEGTQRNLGTHIPVADGTKNIIVGELQWPILNGTSRGYAANLSESTNSILATYTDPTDNTTEVQIAVYELNNESNEIYNQTFSSGPYGTINANISLTAAQTSNNWIVEFTAQTNDDGEVVATVAVGGSALSLPVDPWLLGTFAWVASTFVACLYGPRTARLGAWVLVIFASIMAIFQWVAVPEAAIITAAGIALAGTVYKEAMPG